MAHDPDARIAEVVERERSRLRHFIRRRVRNPRDAQDILQDVFHRLVEANRLLVPICDGVHCPIERRPRAGPDPPGATVTLVPCAAARSRYRRPMPMYARCVAPV